MPVIIHILGHTIQPHRNVVVVVCVRNRNGMLRGTYIKSHFCKHISSFYYHLLTFSPISGCVSLMALQMSFSCITVASYCLEIEYSVFSCTSCTPGTTAVSLFSISVTGFSSTDASSLVLQLSLFESSKAIDLPYEVHG